MNYIRSSGGLSLALMLAAFVTCNGEERAPTASGDGVVIPTGGSSGRGGASHEPDASAGVPDASTAGAGGDAGTDGTVVNCG